MQTIGYKKFGLIFLVSSLLITFSCRKDENPISEKIKKNKVVNEWINGYMEVLYYWNTRLPAKKDLSLSPDVFYESLLYKAEDRFSFIADDFEELMGQLSGVQMEAGYDFTLFLTEQGSKDLVGVVNYIKPFSAASSTDLKRGDIFYTVNGKQLTIDNYQKLANEMSAKHTLGVYRDNKIQSMSLNVTKYEENPIFLDSIYVIDGKKIAYLVYNFFAVDKGDYSYKYLKELNEVFGKYKNNNVDEVILDLRYNTGGQVIITPALAGMISNRSSSDLFCTDQYNSIVDRELKKESGNDYNKTFFEDFLSITDKNGNIVDKSIPINKLTGLPRLYVLTSQKTASASELLINGLKPYMNVILIGDKTLGKNVGMWFIYEQDTKKQKDNRWGLLPIVFKTFNSENKSEYGNGFNVDIKADEYGAFPLLPLGDTDEILLKAALVQIGVKKASGFRSDEKRFYSQPLMSSIDRTPVRKNMIKHQKQLPEIFKFTENF